ncbi:MAG: TIGR02300 family protein [Holosporales bacterium]|nr:TIGR02300 family protein [Holosporales bacterium]
MTETELGKKRICTSCGAKFYDFNKTKVSCPKCHTELNLKPSINRKPKSIEKPPKEIVPEEDLEITEADLDTVSTDDDVVGSESDILEE